MTTILIKKKDTAGAPASGDLTNAAGGAEIAVNTATKRIYTKDSGGNVVELGTNAGSSTIDALTVVTSETLSFGTASTALALDASKNIVSVTNTGTGNNVLATSPTLVTPALGTPSALVGTNITGTATSFNINGTVGATTAAAGTFTSLSDSGNLTFTGTGNRITGDMSNATVASRALLQSSTGTFTDIGALGPSSSTQSSAWTAYLGNDPTNTSRTRMLATSADGRFESGITGTGTYLPMTFYTGGSERMRIDSSGNVGIGTSSPSEKLDVIGNSRAAIATSSDVYFKAQNSAGSLFLLQKSASAAIYTPTTQPLVFDIAGGEKMRIDSSGNLLVGATATVNAAKSYFAFTSASNGVYIADTTGVSSAQFMRFDTASSVVCGQITRVGTTSAVVYTATSDYRLKTVTGAVTGQGARIDALKPIDYQWKENNSQARGFLAHEFQEVYPSSVSGDKDAVDKDGKPAYQSMQASSSEVIADLVAELKSLRKRVAQLEST